MAYFSKIDIFYIDANKKTHYLHSTNSYKLVRDAVEGAKWTLKKPMYANIYGKSIGEKIVLNRIFGRKSKSK